MSIQRRDNGTYVVRWNEGGRKRGRSFDRRRDAEKFEAEGRRRKAMGGIVVLPERVTVSELHDRWLAHLEDKGREKNTLDGYAAMWKHLEPRLAHVLAHEISPATVEALGPQMLRDGVGPCSANKAIGMLSSMMNRAIVWGYVDRNPCDHVERPKTSRKRRIVALSPAQVEMIRAQMNVRDRTLVSALAYAGLRPGEAIALTWEDVKANTIHVDKAVAHGKIKTTKNRKERSVALLPSLKLDLDEYRMAIGRPESGLVFPNGRAGPWTDAKFRNWRTRYFDVAAESAGVPDATPYTLRHTFASLLLAAGRSLPDVAGELGHGIDVLTSTYAHVIAEFRGGGQIDPESTIMNARRRLSSTKQTA